MALVTFSPNTVIKSADVNANFSGLANGSLIAAGATLTSINLSAPRSWDGWQDANETWTYSSVDGQTGVVTVPSDATTKYTVGMRIKLTQSSTVKYAIITAVTSTSLTMFFDTDAVLANSAISANYYSAMKTPFGFPMDPEKWKVEYTDTSDRTQTSPTSGTAYNLNAASLAVPIGEWLMSYQVYYSVSLNGTPTNESLQYGLGTTSSSWDQDMTTYRGMVPGSNTTWEEQTRSTATKYITLAAKTTYYLVSSITFASTTGFALRNFGSRMTTKITARLAYL